MSNRVCPWWAGYLLAGGIRRLWQNPATILGPYLADGMTVLEPGPGMGFFTLEMAARVGPQGRIIAVDIQPRMLAELRRRAEEADLESRIETRLAAPDSMGVGDLDGKVDFVLAFAMVHELPDASRFFLEARCSLKPQGKLLLAEPRFHVTEKRFDATLRIAQQQGLSVSASVEVPTCRAVVLTAEPARS
jgi:ubiquinone/menaquinone biosynthesis C-methylase UbiE